MGFAKNDAGLILSCEILTVGAVPWEKQGPANKGDILTLTPHPEQPLQETADFLYSNHVYSYVFAATILWLTDP